MLAAAACFRPGPAPVPAGEAPPPAMLEIRDEITGATGPKVAVARGDTLYAIARREDVAIRSLIEVNRLEPPFTLRPGQELMVPTLPEYRVAEGDNLYRISRCTGVDLTVLSRLNDIAPPYVISPGQRLRIPPPTRRPECPPQDSRDAAAVPPAPVEQAAARAMPPPRPGPVPEPPPRAGARFLWPAEGRVISDFGPKAGARHNDGVNIAAPSGAPVRAVESGVIVYAGNELRGYGNLLLVRHADGWTSAYAHNAELLVARGETVERGQVIARVGQTGNVAEPQLHFELRKGAEAVNPITYLANN